jgi:LPXTG-site transpeptidase (sortase) family protein
MSEKPLLLSSAKQGVLVRTKPMNPWRLIATAIGLLMVLIGAANVASRVATAAFGSSAALTAFAPAAILSLNPSLGSANSLATSTAAIATTTPVIPTRLQIPSIGVNAHVEQVGKEANGTMGTPQTFGDVAWYEPGQEPGEPGNAVIDGHVNNALTTAGVFEHLSQVNLGDTILVSDASGKTLTYKVVETDEYPADVATSTIESLFTATGPSQLVLYTCEGTWVPSARSFDQRFVVVAALQ